MCNLFRACVYLEEDILNQNRQRQVFCLFVFMSEVTDIPLLIRKYCIIKKARVKLATEPTIHAFLVSSVTRETLTYDVT